MSLSNEPFHTTSTFPDQERDMLLQELEAAHAMNRYLLRQLEKAQSDAAEALRAHAKMVTTLTETMRENMALTIERDTWKARALRSRLPSEPCTAQLGSMLGLEYLTEAEAGAIRKAMARLHHPDAGGDAERMKAWNAVLDRLEQTRS